MASVRETIEREVTGWPGVEEDVEGALELFRLNYERLAARKRGGSRGEELSEGA